MIKRHILLIVAAIMLLCTTAFLVIGCGNDDTDDDSAPKIEYSVTVLSSDEQPLQGITVSWQKSGTTKGSTITGEDGKATVSLASGTYVVVLEGLNEGLVYAKGVSVTSATHDITLTLSAVKVTYTAEVKDKNGAAAEGVKVTWANGDKINTVATGEDGKATCELDYADYTVTVANLPDGNIFTDAISVTGAQPQAIFELRDGKPVEYTVTVRSEGGLKLKDTRVIVYSNDVPIHQDKTDVAGVLTFTQAPGNYTVDVPTVQEGYAVTKKAKLTATVRQGEVVLSSAVIDSLPSNNKRYKIGDIIHDFEFTTPYEVNGKKITYSFADILQTKEAIVINNWGTECSWCVKEMPAMESVYGDYNDKIELLAISNYNGGDSDQTIINYRASGNYTIPMMRDTNSFVLRFGITNFPTTIVIDRYGAIAHIEVGAIPEAEIWERLIKRYIGDDYVQTFTPGEESEPITTEISKPDITVPADHYEKVAAAVNKFEATDNAYVKWYGETKDDRYWPFVLKTETGVSEEAEVLCSSNAKKPNSASALYATVKMPAGKVLTFDYYSQTETGIDTLSAVWDGKTIIRQISGNSRGWKTCYLYAELDSAGEHDLALSYVKDNSADVGLDNVYIRNVRFEDVSAIDESLDMPRTAAYGVRAQNATEYPHYAEVELKDGYYYVKLGSLQNSEYAGDDQSPMLFVNMLGATNWNGRTSIAALVSETNPTTNAYVYNCNFNINGQTRDYRNLLFKYCNVASSSDISGFLPVTQELKDILTAFISVVNNKPARDNEWLELCSFFSHYGEGEFIGNPILGLMTETAIPMQVGQTVTANLNRIMAPFPTEIYAFTPTESAVYKIESLIPPNTEKGSQIWLYDDNTDNEHPLAFSGDERFVRDGVNEQNFVLYRYLTAGHKYYLEVSYLMQEMGDLDFKITNAGQSVTELVPASEGLFNLIYDDRDELIGVELAGAVEYYKDDDGYYRVGDKDNKHANDPYLYFDVKYPTQVSPTMSISQLVTQNLKVPGKDEYCDYKIFDLRYRIAYFTDPGDENIINYDPNFDLVSNGIAGREYKDYTQVMQGYIASAETGDNDGLVKVDEGLIKLLKLYIETRVNILLDNEYEEALDNEWLRFCWYYKTHNAENP